MEAPKSADWLDVLAEMTTFCSPRAWDPDSRSHKVWPEVVAVIRAADADHYGDECECHGFEPNGTHDATHNALAALKAKVENVS